MDNTPEEDLHKVALNYSVIVSVTKQSINFRGSGFLLEKEEEGKKKYFLITSFALTNEAESINFAIRTTYKPIQNNWYKIPEQQPKESSTLDIVIFDVTDIMESKAAKENILNDNHFIFHYDNCKILETLFIVSHLPGDLTKAPIIMECKNVTTLDSWDERDPYNNGFFVLNLKQHDWLLGSPIFGILNEKIKLMGMVISTRELPEGFCPAIASCEIENVLKWG